MTAERASVEKTVENQRLRRSLPLLALLLAIGVWMLLLRQADLPYLDSGPGPWITAPLAPRAEARVAGTLAATFEHSFTLDAAPGRAEVFVRLFEQGEVRLNGQTVIQAETAEGQHGASWKTAQTAHVGPYLQPGPNLLQVDVRRHGGPPALSLALRTGNRRLLTTDADWTVSVVGSTPTAVQLATTRPRTDPPRLRPGAVDPAAEHVGSALAASFPALLLVLILALLTGAAASIPQLRRRLWPARLRVLKRREPWIWTVLLAALWMALFVNNAGHFPPTIGFDARGHLDYIHVVLREGRLPLAEEGWQMYQPPLFYLLSAFSLHQFAWDVSSTGSDFGARYVIRAITFTAGFLQMLLIYATARRLWPEQPARPRLALLLAAGLPVHLYLFHYASNETIATTLSAAVVWAFVSWLKQPRGSTEGLVLVGILLGLALLAKVTAILLLAAIIATLLLRPWLVLPREKGQRATSTAWLKPALIVAGLALLVGGWHYGRAALEYGNPLIGNWDSELGFTWWQDPGYRTLADFADLPTLGLGTTLTQPWFAGFAGTGAGLTSTLFGDALAGGEAELRLGAPWNHTWMAAGYAFAPLILLLAGIGLVRIYTFVTDFDAVRHSKASRGVAAAWIFLLATGALVVAALLYMALKVPSYAQAKAFYGQPALPLLVLLAALGADTLLRYARHPAARTALLALLLTWASWSWASVWIRPETPATQVMRGLQLLQTDRPERAGQLFDQAAKVRPDWAEPHLGRFWVASGQGDSSTAAEAAQAALDADPSHPEALMAAARSQAQDPARAEQWLRLAIESDPGDARGPALLVDLLLRQNRQDDARAVLRQQLLASPGEPEVHLRLAALYYAAGDLQAARQQLHWLADARPDDPRARQALDTLARPPIRAGDPPS